MITSSTFSTTSSTFVTTSSTFSTTSSTLSTTSISSSATFSITSSTFSATSSTLSATGCSTYKDKGMVSNFHVALVSVENNGFLRVVLFHHFHSQTTNGRLEVGLFGVNHASEIDNTLFIIMLFYSIALYIIPNWIGRVCLIYHVLILNLMLCQTHANQILYYYKSLFSKFRSSLAQILCM